MQMGDMENDSTKPNSKSLGRIWIIVNQELWIFQSFDCISCMLPSQDVALCSAICDVNSHQQLCLIMELIPSLKFCTGIFYTARTARMDDLTIVLYFILKSLTCRYAMAKMFVQAVYDCNLINQTIDIQENLKIVTNIMYKVKDNPCSLDLVSQILAEFHSPYSEGNIKNFAGLVLLNGLIQFCFKKFTLSPVSKIAFQFTQSTYVVWGNFKTFTHTIPLLVQMLLAYNSSHLPGESHTRLENGKRQDRHPMRALRMSHLSAMFCNSHARIDWFEQSAIIRKY